MATRNQVDVALSGSSGTGSFAGTTSPSFTTPALGTPSAGVLSSCTGYAQSALTGLGTGVSTALGNNVTGSGGIALATSAVLVTPTLGAATATSLTFNPTTGGIVGTTTNNNADAGKVGEYIFSQILVGTPTSISTGVAANVTSISLTAGDWSVSGNLYVDGTTVTLLIGSINTTSATLTDSSLSSFIYPLATGSGAAMPICTQRMSLSGTTTVYLVVNATGTGTMHAAGLLAARRIR